MTRPEIVVKMIVDGHHLAAETVQVVWACAAGRVALITDAMAAAGAGGGTFRFGEAEVDVEAGARRCWRTKRLREGAHDDRGGAQPARARRPLRARHRRGDGGPRRAFSDAATSECSSRGGRRTSWCWTTGPRFRPSSAVPAPTNSWPRTEPSRAPPLSPFRRDQAELRLKLQHAGGSSLDTASAEGSGVRVCEQRRVCAERDRLGRGVHDHVQPGVDRRPCR